MERLLEGTFFLYLFSSVAFVVGMTSQNENKRAKWGKAGITMAIIGAVIQIAFITTRIIIGGHFPTSNMFEFIAFLCFALVLGFIVLFFIYRSYLLGAFSMPMAVILLAYASIFPTEVQPLIPALQSHWLYIHVTTAAVGQGLFGVAAVSGIIYLIRKVAHEKKGKNAFFLEITLLVLVMFLSFSAYSYIFRAMDYKIVYAHEVEGQVVAEEYELPPLIKPNASQLVEGKPSFSPIAEAPSWMKGNQAGKKLNSVIWAIITGLLIYAIYFLLVRKPIHRLLEPLVNKVDDELLDEITYRAIAIGYPIFTLGALIFAMIWAHEAWGRFWGWDPKETWAFITWMFYSAYLHLRLSRGWHGTRSAWLAVGGFTIIMINLIVVNLIISGLHSYA